MENNHLMLVVALNHDLSCAQRMVLVILLLSNGIDGNCYLSIETIAARAGLSSRRTVDQLNALRERGLISRRDAAEDPDSPKAQGWIYTVNLQALDTLSAPTSRQDDAASSPTQRHPDKASGKARPPKKNAEEVETSHDHRSAPMTPRHPSTTVHYSDTSKGEDRSTSSATSRACATAREETTYSAPPSDESMPPKPIQPAEVAAIKQALEAALPTLDLSGVKGLYGLAQAILAGRDGLDEAKLYVEQRGLEWTQRLLDGQRYPAYAIVRLIAKDAPSWRPPQALKSTSQPHTATPQATADAERPWWWGALMRALLDALKAHRSANTAQSRAHAHQLAGLLHHLQRAHEVRCEANALHIVIEDAGPTPEELALVTSYIPVLLDRVAGVELRAAHLIPHTAHRRAS